MNQALLKGLYGCRPAVIAVAVLVGACAGNGQAPAGTGQSANAAPVQPPSLVAKFDSNVDTKSAKAGEPVTAKTTRALKLAEIEIPKGAKLIGSVTSVKSMQEGNGDSMLGVRFERVEIKGDKVLGIRGLIVAIGPTPRNETGLGYDSVINRGGLGPNSDLDPTIAADKYDKDKPELTKGSTLAGVALGMQFDADGATLIRGVHRDIKLNQDVTVRVALYRAK